MTDELIIEAQQHYSEMNGLNSRAAEVMMELVAALEAATRVPVQGEPNDDRPEMSENSVVAYHQWRKALVRDRLSDDEDTAARIAFYAGWDRGISRATVPDAATAELTEAIRLTVEYTGNDLLPAIVGWSWFDALKKYAPDVAPAFVDKPIRFPKIGEPDAATEAKQPDGWSNEDAQAAADQAFARWSTHDERDVWNRNGFRLGAEWQKARETFISYKAIADEARAERDAALAAVERVRAVCLHLGGVVGDVSQPAPSYYVSVGRNVVATEVLAALDGAPEPEVKP